MKKISYVAGTPSWVDLGSSDPSAAAGFYAALFGWDVRDLGEEAGGYRMAEIGGLPVAGIGSQQSPEAPPYWTTYMSVDDADAAAATLKAAGASVFAEPFDVMDVGRMAVFADPTGAVFSIWQAKTHTGAGLVEETGSMCWHELYTRDPMGAKAFYSQAFGWEAVDEDMGGFAYTTWKLGDATVGGMIVLGENMPADMVPHWLVYFAVDDCDAAVAQVTELGGSVRMPATDVPPGRFAVVTDPQGAVFGIIKPSESAVGSAA